MRNLVLHFQVFWPSDRFIDLNLKINKIENFIKSIQIVQHESRNFENVMVNRKN